MKDLVYLAGPISTTKPGQYLERIRAHAKCAVQLESQGKVNIYSPACETHGYVELGGKIGTSWKDWKQHDLNILSRCNKLYVMLLDGWKESIGVKGEVKYALKNNIPIEFVNVEGTVTIITDVLEMFDIKEVEELND